MVTFLDGYCSVTVVVFHENRWLAKYGFSIRGDHRTLKAQKVEAEKNGDDLLAKLYKRVPEEHIGVIATHRDGSPATEVKKYREAIQSKQHSLFLVDINQKATEEGETQFFVNQAEGASRVLMNSQAYRSANLNDESLRLLNQELIARLTRIRELKKLLIAEKRFKALNRNYFGRKKNFVYRIIQPVSSSIKTPPLTENELTGIIADALMNEPYAIQLVARSDGNNLEMEKDWEMMTEFYKDEIINKKMIREL